MKIVGLVAEYNPFHNGHFYHIEEAKKQTGADYTVIAMSGNFVQRGEPACIDKYIRAEMAIRAGADLVFEIPAIFATASAEYFANGAISLLNGLGCIDTLCFGSEWGQMDDFYSLAKILSTEPEEYKTQLTKALQTGKSFPEARQAALSQYLGNSSSALVSLLSSPNNILGLEYLKALQKNNSPILPYTIKRKESNYHDRSLTAAYSSATAIRHLLNRNTFPNELSSQVPSGILSIYKDIFHKTSPILPEHFESLLSYKLLSEDTDHLNSYFGMPSALANRIKKKNCLSSNYQERILSLKTRELTYTSISRALLHVLLNITKENMNLYCTNGYVQYARLLAAKKDSTFLIREMKKKGRLPILTKISKEAKLLPSSGLNMLTHDIYCSDIYRTVVYQTYGTEILDEYRHPIFFG